MRERLAATARDWLPQLFPHARLSPDQKTLRCADLSGRPPRKEGSCVIHLEGRFAGWGFDYATGESAGPIDLIYHATGLTNGSLFEEAARLAAHGPSGTAGARTGQARSQPRGRPHPRRLPPARRNAGGDVPAGPGLERSRLSRSVVPPGPDRLRWVPRLAGHGGPAARRERRAGRRHPSHLSARRRLGQGAARQEDAGHDRGRLRPPEPDRRGRSSRHRRGHRDGAVGAGDLRRADLGGAVGRRPAPLAMAGRRQPRDDLRRRRRCRCSGRRGARRSPEHRRHRQRDPSRRCTATTSTTTSAGARRRPITGHLPTRRPRRQPCARWPSSTPRRRR